MPSVRRYQAPVETEQRAQWGDIRAELLRREPHGGSQDRFLLPWHTFAMTFSGWREPGAVTRFGGGKPIRHQQNGPGDLFLLPAGVDDATTLRGASAMEYMVLFVPPKSLASLMPEAAERASAELLPTMNLESPISRSLMYALRNELAARNPLGRLFAESAVTILLTEAFRHSSNQEPSRPVESRGGLPPYQLKRVTDYIHDRLTDDLSLAELAGVVGLSTHHFCRVFKQSTGMPPHRWQIQKRVERAQALMLGTDLRLADVALAAGFSDQSHFTTVFRRTTGDTPHAWRRSQRH